MATELHEEIDDQFVPWQEVAAPEPAELPHYASSLDTFVDSLKPKVRARRSDSGRWLDLHLLTVLAVVGALPALRLPTTWVVVSITFAVCSAGVRIARAQSAHHGTADLVVIPARVIGKLALGCINPMNWLKLFLGGLAALAAGAVAGALLGAARWVASDGFGGILAAARTGAWAHALTFGAAVACYLLLSGIGTTHDRRASALHRVTRDRRESVLVLIVVFPVAASAWFTFAGPGHDLDVARDHDGLGWVPSALRQYVDDGRDDIVQVELDAVTSCLSGDEAGLWTGDATAGNDPDEPDVVTLTADPARAPGQPAIAVAALAAHNHLAPWVEIIRVKVGDDVALLVNRDGIPTDTPLTDAAALRDHAIGAPEWLTTVAGQVDTGLVLDCSARTPL